MSYFDKPGIKNCKKDGKTHRYLEHSIQRAKHSGTVSKIVITGETSGEKLSRKNKSKLYNSTYDNLMPGVKYSMNKAQHWNIFKSLTAVVDKVTPEENEYSVAMVKGQKLDSRGTYRSFAVKKPNEDTKFIEVNSGKGASFMCLHNELEEKKKKKKGQKVQKYSAMTKFRETPSVLFVVEERHPSDTACEASAYKWRSEKWPEKKWYLKVNSIDNTVDEEIFDEDIIDPCTLQQSNLTFGDCFVQKSFQNTARRKNDNSFEKVIFDDPVFDKVKQRPPVVFESSLSNQNIESAIFSYNKNSMSSLKFDGIEFMYDLLWLNEEKTKCLFIIPKGLEKECSNFDSWIFLEFFGGKKQRLRLTTNSIHKKINFPLTDVNINLKEIIIKIWRTSIYNSEMCDSFKKPSMTFCYPNTAFTTTGKPVGDFDLLFRHQPKLTDINDFQILPLNSRCCVCNYKNATLLNCGHNFCQECSTKMIKYQIEGYAEKLCCSICSSILDPLFVFFSTPLLLLRAYLRSKFFENLNTTKCPNCNNDLIFDDKDALNIKCKKCGTVFCQSCKQVPHFPLQCSKMNRWIKIMLKQTWFTYYGNFKCSCKQLIELSRNQVYLEYANKITHCPNWDCHNQYLLSWPKMRLPVLLNSHKSITKFIETDLSNFITNSVAFISVDTFNKRITSTYQNRMVRKITEISSLTSSEARMMLNESLHFLEYGTAFLYFKRRNFTDNDKILKKYFDNLRSIMLQIEMCKIQDSKAKTKFVLWQKILNKIFSKFTVSNLNL